MRFNILFSIILTFFLVGSVYAFTTQTTYLPAVRMSNGKEVGALATLTVEIKPGSGHVFVDTLPLTEVNTQASARLAKEVTQDVTGVDLSDYDIFYTIRSESPIIGGPSAGGAIAAAMIANVLDLNMNKHVVMTGTINPDGSIGPIGGLLEKAQAVAENGGTVFLVPEGQSIVGMDASSAGNNTRSIVNTSSSKINLTDYAWKKWKLRVSEVSDVQEAISIMTGYKFTPVAVLREDNQKIKSIMKEMSDELFAYAKAKLDYAKSLGVKENKPLEALKDGEQKLNKSLSYLKSEQYYSASSLAFVSSVKSEYTKNSVGFDKADDKKAFLLSLVKNASDENAKLSKELTSTAIDSIEDIEIKTAAEERLVESDSSLADASNNIKKKRYDSAISSISYAIERKKTAEIWLSFTAEFASDKKPDLNKLKSLALRRIDDAESAMTYAETVSQSDLLRSASDLIDQAKEKYNNGSYASAIFDSLMARIDSDITMETRGLDESDVEARLNRTSQHALRAIYQAEKTGATPILAINYYEYASSLADEQPVTALLYYKYSKEFAGMSEDIYSVYNPSASQQEQYNQPEILQSAINSMVLFMVGCIVGFLIAKLLIKGRMKKHNKHKD